MQIILFGQPELDKNLLGKNIRQLRERITHSFYLEPMTLEQTGDYLHYRLQAAGCPWPQVFTKKAEKLLNKASEGLTRRVNILADKSLMAAYASSTIQSGHQFGAIQQKVLPQHVKAAIKDSGYGMRHLWLWTAIYSGFGLLIVALGFYFGINAMQPEQQVMPLQSISELAENSPQPTEMLEEIEAEQTNISNQQEQSTSQELMTAGDSEERTTLAQADVNLDQFDNVLDEITVSELLTDFEPAEIDTEETQILDSLIAEPKIEEIIESVQELEANDILLSSNQIQATQESSDVLIEEAEDQIEQREDITEEMQPEIQNQPSEQVSDALPMEATGFSSLSGLIGVRARASSEWLENIARKNSYTVQMASFPIADEPMLEEYLQLLSLTELLNETYLCLISRTANRPQQWLVIHGDFSGVSRARDYIGSLPAYSRQYEPFARNSNSIACLSDIPANSLSSF